MSGDLRTLTTEEGTYEEYVPPKSTLLKLAWYCEDTHVLIVVFMPRAGQPITHAYRYQNVSAAQWRVLVAADTSGSSIGKEFQTIRGNATKHPFTKLEIDTPAVLSVADIVNAHPHKMASTTGAPVAEKMPAPPTTPRTPRFKFDK